MRLPDIFKQLFNEKYRSINCKKEFFTLSEEYITDFIGIKNIGHVYGLAVYNDQLHLHIPVNELCNLGLLILALLFSENSREVCINLSHKESEIKKLKIRFDKQKSYFDDLHLLMKIDKYRYKMIEYEKHPFDYNEFTYDLPGFFLTNDKEQIRSKEDIKSRDVLVITGSYVALILLADFLINVSHPKHFKNRDEYVFENEPGYVSTCPGSAELCLWIHNKE